MKVLILKTNEQKEFNDSYAARLIEQGKAIVVEKKTAKKAEKGEEA